MKNKITVLVAVLGLLALSGFALAAPEDSEDTTFSYGYDEANRVLVWGASPVDAEAVCDFTGELEVTYGASIDDILDVSLAEEGDCDVSGTSVEGPNGQVNHGMFMRAFNHMYDGSGRGCLARFLAQSGLGKDTQQIQVPDVDPEAPQVEEGTTGTVDFTSVLADCEHGNGNKPEDAGAEGRANAAAKKAEHAGGEHGNSANAPGHNK